MNRSHTHIVKATMLIRRPASTVFEAFVDPSKTTNFWFTRSSGPLKEGQTVRWYWEMYGVSTDVYVKEIIPDEKITILWGDPQTTVDFKFHAINENATFVIINHYGFDQSGDELINALTDSTGGFTMVLAGLKAYLEYQINLKLVADKYPNEAAQLAG